MPKITSAGPPNQADKQRDPEDAAVHLVQGLEELELPFPEAAGERDLIRDRTRIPSLAPEAPEPDHLFANPAAIPKPGPRDVFKDQTPRGRSLGRSDHPESAAIPAATDPAPSATKHVQAPSTSRFETTSPPASPQDSGDDIFSLPMLPEAAAESQPSEDVSPAGEDPISITDLLAEPLPVLEEDPSFDPFSDPPPLENEATTETLPAPDVQSPSEYFGQEDDAAGMPLGELSATNGQDCSANAAACRADFDQLKRRERTDFSLDITPSIEPRVVDMAQVNETRVNKLAKAPSRTWTSRKGKVLTDGTLEDYREGRVHVRTLNGSLRKFAPHELSDEDWCFVTAWWELPPECRFGDETYVVRDFRLTTFTWTAPSTCHKPLYFEEVAVERYGHSAGPIVQPLVSGAHFFGNVAMLPYHMGLNPPNECLYTLGYYRPGSCAPWLVHGFPLTTRGLKWQGLVTGAAIPLLP